MVVVEVYLLGMVVVEVCVLGMVVVEVCELGMVVVVVLLVFAVVSDSIDGGKSEEVIIISLLDIATSEQP